MVGWKKTPFVCFSSSIFPDAVGFLLEISVEVGFVTEALGTCRVFLGIGLKPLELSYVSAVVMAFMNEWTSIVQVFPTQGRYNSDSPFF